MEMKRMIFHIICLINTLLFAYPFRLVETRLSFKNYAVFHQMVTQGVDPPKIMNGKNLRSFGPSSENDGKLSFVQKTSGPVPRPYLPSGLMISSNPPPISAIEEGLQWYLATGGRLKNLYVVCPQSNSNIFTEMGSVTKSLSEFEVTNLLEKDISNYSILQLESNKFQEYIKKRLEMPHVNKFVLYDILGRILQDLGDAKSAIESYTNSLLAAPQHDDSSPFPDRKASVFRNLGSAYHADGNHQMAFASYQQAIAIDPTDALVYVKLAFLYEDLASKDWEQSFENAVKCYQYYLEKVDPEDTTILTRLGNLFMKENFANEALETYHRALALEPNLHIVWFNSAHALLKMNGYEGAKEALRRALEGDPNNVAARHMLTALSEEDAQSVMTADPNYVKQLFDDYGKTYDQHTKKLLYSAPRVIRSELAKIYKDKYEVEMARRIQENRAYFAPSYLQYMEKSLDILDLGCGTGQVGKWLKDYAKELVGVDISSEMITKAKTKLLYTDLKVNSLGQFLDENAKDGKKFDVVAAADVFQYIGDLSQTIPKSAAAVRKGGYLIFTIETEPPKHTGEEPGSGIPEKGFVLQRNGRFAYKRSYVQRLLAAEKGLKIIVDRDFSPRYDAGAPVPGFLFVAEKVE